MDINELYRSKIYECMDTKPTITIGDHAQDCELHYASDTYWNCTIRENQPLFDGRNRDAQRNLKSERTTLNNQFRCKVSVLIFYCQKHCFN